MTAHLAHRDERTLVVENESYRWAYHVFSYALLVDVMYRGWVHQEAAWDLFVLLGLGGLVPLAYQSRHHVVTSRSVVRMAVAAVTAALVAAAVAWLVWF